MKQQSLAKFFGTTTNASPKSMHTTNSAASETLVQSYFNVGTQRLYEKCAECGMEFNASCSRDVTLHKRHHRAKLRSFTWQPTKVFLLVNRFEHFVVHVCDCLQSAAARRKVLMFLFAAKIADFIVHRLPRCLLFAACVECTDFGVCLQADGQRRRRSQTLPRNRRRLFCAGVHRRGHKFACGLRGFAAHNTRPPTAAPKRRCTRNGGC